MAEIKKNSLVELNIESIAFGAKGIARINDFVVFVRDALPGQKVKALIIKKKAAFAEAIIREVLEPSPGRSMHRVRILMIAADVNFRTLNIINSLI